MSLTRKPTPLHLWIVGVVALLWELMGVFDYLMTETRNEAYMSRFSQEQLDFFYGYPNWLISVWAIAVWSSLIGVIFLLLRRRFAEPVLLLSFIAMAVSMIYNYGFSNGMDVMGGVGSMVFTGVIFLSGLALYFYARAMRRRGVLV